ncbi:MAG: helix-turn-helix transcriptional regulator [Eggerthellaceae bacterium]|nr:helix-turn-helix transcriptional regulator [Eggerthellaceae bacterium]
MVVNKLVAYMRNHGITVEALAIAIKMPVADLSAMLNREVPLDLAVLALICKHLGVPIDFFLSETLE